MGRGAEAGILVRDAALLESAGKMKAVVWDKTGTLTTGDLALASIRPLQGGEYFGQEVRLLQLVASAEARSEHPLARGVVAGAQARNLSLSPADAIAIEAGRGLRAIVDGRRVVVGNRNLAESVDRGAAAQLEVIATEEAHAGRTPLYVLVDERAVGVISLADSIRPEVAEAIQALASRGVRSWIVSGDRQEVVDAVAAQLGLTPERAIGGTLPSEKAQALAKIREREGSVGAVGDGINDAPMLAAADVGIAMGGGTEVASDAASATLSSGSPSAVVALVDLARATTRTIRQNLAWAFGYNLLLVPLAAGLALPAFGIGLDPAIAAAAMGLSSVSVVANSLRLRRLKLSA
jgi:Cu+-exporting ATPase